SDTLIALSGSPVGGSWSGIGVSGFNFVPTATAVGTYNLTYSFTNPAGCTSTATVVAKVEDCPERLRLLRDDAVILFPNPNNGIFNIRINSTLYNYIGMKVYNVQGQLMNGVIVNDVLNSPVYTNLVYGRIVPIDLSHLPGGIYMVKFFFDDGVRTAEKSFRVVIAR
ncbi:MAG: T9SS type A sorting domain-containing protein, partial [Bacteroidota bacterium]|nr:T9SS type A sorting domain-containing protein [Bacteroidota bacterium]